MTAAREVRPTPAADRLPELATRLAEVDRALWEALVEAATRPIGGERPRRGTPTVLARYRGALEMYGVFSGLTTDEIQAAVDADLEHRYGPRPLHGWRGCGR